MELGDQPQPALVADHFISHGGRVGGFGTFHTTPGPPSSRAPFPLSLSQHHTAPSDAASCLKFSVSSRFKSCFNTTSNARRDPENNIPICFSSKPRGDQQAHQLSTSLELITLTASSKRLGRADMILASVMSFFGDVTLICFTITKDSNQTWTGQGSGVHAICAGERVWR